MFTSDNVDGVDGSSADRSYTLTVPVLREAGDEVLAPAFPPATSPAIQPLLTLPRMLNVDRPSDATATITAPVVRDFAAPITAAATSTVTPTLSAASMLDYLRRFWPWLLVAVLVAIVATRGKRKGSD